MSFQKPLELISFGEPMVEFNAKTVGRLRDVKTFERGFGGDTSNMVVALAKLGHKCGYVTKLGEDEFGMSLMELWENEGVDTSHVLFEKDGFTGIYFVSRTEDGRHEFTYFRKGSAASKFIPEELDVEYINRAKIFHTSGITQAISLSCRKTVERAIESLNRNSVKFSYDPNLRLRLWSLEEARTIIMDTIRQADIVFPSIEDARTLLGVESPDHVAKRILELGAKVVALKLGADGCIVADENIMVHVPAFQVKVVDTTGAGDAFDAGFLAAILEGKTMQQAAIYANAVAALKCRGKGAIIPQPRRQDVDYFLSKIEV
jgi:2-dehydro-3-deoxygluconokinase